MDRQLSIEFVSYHIGEPKVDALDCIKDGNIYCAPLTVRFVVKNNGVEIPEDEEYDTIGGYLSYVAGHIPAQDESIETPELMALVSKANNRRAIEVQLSRLEGDLEVKSD